jgi:hypothetical protein
MLLPWFRYTGRHELVFDGGSLVLNGDLSIATQLPAFQKAKHLGTIYVPAFLVLYRGELAAKAATGVGLVTALCTRDPLATRVIQETNPFEDQADPPPAEINARHTLRQAFCNPVRRS